MVSPQKNEFNKPMSRDVNTLKKYCFYLDIKNNSLSKQFAKRFQDLGLRTEVFLSDRVTHIVWDGINKKCVGSVAAPVWTQQQQQLASGGGCKRADAMLQRVIQQQNNNDVILCDRRSIPTLTLEKANRFLDRVYNTFYRSILYPHFNTKVLKGAFIKFDSLDSFSRPVYKEFTLWPEISTEAEITESIGCDTKKPMVEKQDKMTRKTRGREPEKGYCEMCSCTYADAALHRRSPHHLAYVRDRANFMSLDNLIGAGADVSSFLNKSAPLNGERRSLRKICNGTPKTEEDSKNDKEYYKVVGVSAKLRSGGGFTPRKDVTTPTMNGTVPPLVVKFRRVRRSELSVLSDEAEQFMFPKKDDSSTEEDEDAIKPSVQRPTTPTPPMNTDRKRLARPTALKEESSDDEFDDRKPRKRKHTAGRKVVNHTRRMATRLVAPEPQSNGGTTLKQESSEDDFEDKPDRRKVSRRFIPVKKEETQIPEPETTEAAPVVMEAENKIGCLQWENGRLKASLEVEQLTFSFESVPRTEPWFESFSRQDEGRSNFRDVSRLFAAYIKSPQLPYEMVSLPPLKPNCCKLSEQVNIQPPKTYGTRNNKRLRIKRRMPMSPKLPRKSPREHASTLAMLGMKRKPDDTTSLNSIPEESDVPPDKPEQTLQELLDNVFQDAGEYDIPMESMECSGTVERRSPDVSLLLSESDQCEMLVDSGYQIPKRKGRFKRKKKNRTGWPNRKRSKNCESDDEASQGSTVTENGHDSDHNIESRCNWELQPVVRVTKIEEEVGRRLRSSAPGSDVKTRSKR